MSAFKKPNANSILQTLPEERQSQVIELMKIMSIEKTRLELAKDGLKVSAGSLSEFFSWYHLRLQFRENSARAAALTEEIAKQQPDLEPEKLKMFGDLFFTQLAISQQDNEGWTNLRRTALKEEQIAADKKRLELDVQKFQFEAARACQENFPAIAAVMRDKSLDEDDKLEQVRMRLFGRTPA